MTETILILGLLFNFIVGLIVLINNKKQTVNRLLFFIALSLGFWQMSNYLADLPTSFTLFWNRASFIGPLIVLPLLAVLVVNIRNKRTINSKIKTRVLIAGSTLFSVLAIFTNSVVKSVSPRLSDGSVSGYELDRGVGYYFLVAWLVGALIVILINLHTSYKSSYGRTRQQLAYIMAGLALAGFAGILTNLILPIVTGTTVSAQLAPITSIIFYGLVAYAIVKHRLFDIRIFAARLLAYLLSIGLLLALFGLSFALITSYMFPAKAELSVPQLIVLVTTMVMGAFFLQPLKLFFDKISNRIFYQDAYDSQQFLDELNELLVSTIDINKLLTDSSNIFTKNLKASFISVAIVTQDNKLKRVSSPSGKEIDKQESVDLLNSLMNTGSTVFSTESLNDGHKKLQKVLQSYDIAICSKLLSNASTDIPNVGGIFFGYKKSGNPYTQQDLKMIETTSSELAIAIENALRFEEIQKFNVKLQKEVEEATSQLKEKNRRLIELDQTKDDFISMASHQLRTPLTSVKGYLSMTLEGDAGKLNEKQKNLLTQAFISSERMVYLISDMLNLSRLKTGKFVIDTGPVNLAELIDTEIAQLQGTAKARDLKLTFEKPANFPILMLDETKIRQVIMNFVDNAIYYTPSGGEIDVKLVDKDKSIELTVTDTGIGVPKSERHHLFSKFYRAKNAKKARPDGTGLGLFMAKKVIIAQGGGIIFHSQEGKGSTFGFTFNKKQLTPKDKN